MENLADAVARTLDFLRSGIVMLVYIWGDAEYFQFSSE